MGCSAAPPPFEAGPPSSSERDAGQPRGPVTAQSLSNPIDLPNLAPLRRVTLRPDLGAAWRAFMVPERFDFPNAAGELLAARLERPSQEPIAYALFAHCFTCSKDSLAARRISGLGSSEGDFANTHFSSNVADVVAAADHLRKTPR